MYSPPPSSSSVQVTERQTSAVAKEGHSPPPPTSTISTKLEPQQQHRKLPSLPPLSSLVSSLAESDFGHHHLPPPHRHHPVLSNSASASGGSKSSSQTGSPVLHNRERDQLQHPSGAYHHQYSPLHHQSYPEIESNTRSTAWESTRHRTATPSSSTEELKRELPLPPGYREMENSSSTAISSNSNNPASGRLAGLVQQMEWDTHTHRNSATSAASSSSTTYVPRSPVLEDNNNSKRRRLSSSAVVDMEMRHANDDSDLHAQIDELSPSMPPTESASPPGGGNSSNVYHQQEQQDDRGSDEKGANGRTLKQTKRAAQNRAAQQAFRKRKEERIKELEEKEKVLNSLVAREHEVARRERELLEREQQQQQQHQQQQQQAAVAAASRSGMRHNQHPSDPREAREDDNGHLPEGSMKRSPQAGRSTTTAAQVTNDWDRAFANAPVASPVQHIAERLELSNRANEELRNVLNDLKIQMASKESLIDSLRRSLEDLGAENRNLRDALAGRQQQQQHQQQHSDARLQHSHPR